MKDAVTLKELAAIVIRSGRIIVTLALIVALALGGMEFSQQLSEINAPENSIEQIEMRNQKTMQAYLQEKGKLENELLNLQKQKKNEEEYLENSLLMRIDPYNKAETSLNVAITDFEEGLFQQVYQIQGTPVDYIVSRIQSQYLVRWNSANLQDELSVDHPDKYLREVVKVSAVSGGLLEIVAYGSSEAESEALAEAVYEYLMKSTDIVGKSAYPHGFALLSKSTKCVVDVSLQTLRKSVENTIETLVVSAEEIQLKLDALEQPAQVTQATVRTAVIASVKNAILGGVLGVFLGVVWAIIGYLFGNKLVLSYHLEYMLSAPMMASVTTNKDIWNKIADRILGERVWKNEDQALRYLEECVSLRMTKGERIALLSTIRNEKNMHGITKVIERLEQNGYPVQYVNDAYYSAQVLNVLGTCDSVILLEKCNVSRVDAINTVVTLAKEQDKPIKGYVLI